MASKPDHPVWAAIRALVERAGAVHQIGMRGSGKSTGGKIILACIRDRFPGCRIIGLDWIGGIAPPGGFDMVDGLPDDPKKLPHRAWVRFTDGVDVASLVAFFRGIGNIGPAVIYLDEGAPHEIKRALPDLVRFCRNYRVGVVLNTQRLTDAEPATRQNCSVTLSFRQKSEKDTRALEEDSTGTGWDRVRGLNPGDFLIRLEEGPFAPADGPYNFLSGPGKINSEFVPILRGPIVPGWETREAARATVGLPAESPPVPLPDFIARAIPKPSVLSRAFHWIKGKLE